MRVVFSDPAGFTPSYDHELSVALARAGAEVELVTSPFRFGVSSYPADGYRRSEAFYPVSSRLFRRSRLRMPLKAWDYRLFRLRSVARLPVEVELDRQANRRLLKVVNRSAQDLTDCWVVIDGRNLFDATKMRSMGFTYDSIGRGTVGARAEVSVSR